MKLTLPFLCVALLGVGIMPVAASSPISVSDETNFDPTETKRAGTGMDDPSSISPDSEDGGGWYSAIAKAIESPQLFAEKSQVESTELSAGQQPVGADYKLNSDVTLQANEGGVRPILPPNISETVAPSVQTAENLKVNEIEEFSTSAEGLLPRQPSFTFSSGVQISQSVVQVTGVRLNSTPEGLEVILDTASGQVLQANTRAEGKTLIAEIANAQLALPGGGEFNAENPLEGINSVTVTAVDAVNIRISITGKENLPTAGVVRSDSGLILSVSTKEIQITVTARQQTPYRAPIASTATRTDTPIRDIPQSIQVVPQEVIEDQQVTRLDEALRNVSGVTLGGESTGRGGSFGLRGFGDAPVLRDGFRRYGNFESFPEVANLDRVEVLKGPASILYGEIQPGGLINLVSKQPLSEPFYEAQLQLGSRNFIEPRFDISGPLTSDRSLLYRLNGLYRTSENFVDYDQDAQRFFIGPTLAWKISDRADLTVSLEYTDDKRAADHGLPVLGNRVVDVGRDRVAGEPDDRVDTQYFNVGYNFEYRFSNNWKLRNAFRYSSYNFDFNVVALPIFFDEETAEVNRFFASQDGQDKNYALQTNIVGEFATGSVQHTLIFGADISYNDERIFAVGDFITPQTLNIFNPVYRKVLKPDEDTLPDFGGNDVETSRYGFYVQDQISIFDNLKLLAGLRYDTAEQKNRVLPGTSNPDASETTENYDDFTPRVGIVYQLIPELSLYASYSRSFNPGSATTAGGALIEPETGSGCEVGVKAELLDRRLAATVAYFDIKKQNVAVTDPNNSLFLIASGEQQSRGVELDISGQILPGWNIIAAYAYTDAEVTADTDRELVGNRLFNVPKHSGSLWTTYQIQSGDLQGLGFGVGFNFVGERQGDLANSFQVDSYFLPNAAVFYQRDNWRAAINIKNLFNVNYIKSVSNTRDSSNQPGEPLTVIASFTVQL